MILNEILFNLMMLQQGRIKTIEKIFYIRQAGSSQVASNLNKHHNTLESFLIDDVFHCFNNFLRDENLTESQGDSIRIIKAFASFIGIWCHRCTDQYREIGYFEKIKVNAKEMVIKSSTLAKLTRFIYFQISYLISDSAKRRSVRTQIIDKYVLDASVDNRSRH